MGKPAVQTLEVDWSQVAFDKDRFWEHPVLGKPAAHRPFRPIARRTGSSLLVQVVFLDSQPKHLCDFFLDLYD